MKPTLTYREARVIRSAREVAEQCDYARARRTEPDEPLHSQPLADAIKRWAGRVLKPNPMPGR